MSSDSELDDELLQVAGQSRQGKKGSVAKRKRAKKVQSNSDEEVSLDEDSDWEAEEYGASTKRAKQPSRTRTSMGNDDGDAVVIQGDLIAGEEDRLRLAAMTELEREMELAERAEKRQQELQRAQLLRQQSLDQGPPKKAPTKRKGRAAAAADGDSDGAAAARRSGREVREEAAKKSAMEELKAARQRKARGEKARTSPEDEAGSEAADADDLYARQAADLGGELSDLEEGETAGGRGARRRRFDEDEEGQEEASYEEVKGIQVRRHRLEEWVAQPFFEGTMPGCMVRVLAGSKKTADGQVVLDPTTGQPLQQYFLAQVVDVEERPAGVHKYADGMAGWKTPYPFGAAGGHKTHKWLRIARGFSERWWPLAQVSNSPATESEFQRWHTQCETDRRPQLTCAEVAEVRSRLVKAENYTYTAEDVAKLLEAKRAKGTARRNVVLEKARLERARDAAAEAGNAEGAAEAQAEIDALEAGAVAAAAARKGGTSMASLNRKNADMNFQNAFKNVGNKVAGQGGGEGDAAAATLDPFSRRATRPMIYWNTKQQNGEPVGEEESGGGGVATANVDTAGAEPTVALPHASRLAAAAVEDIVDLSALDLTVLELPSKASALARRLLGAAWAGGGGTAAPAVAAGAPVISLQEYRQRHGMV